MQKRIVEIINVILLFALVYGGSRLGSINMDAWSMLLGIIFGLAAVKVGVDYASKSKTEQLDVRLGVIVAVIVVLFLGFLSLETPETLHTSYLIAGLGFGAVINTLTLNVVERLILNVKK